MTPIEKAHLRLKCIEVALVRSTKLDFEKELCLPFAEKIYKFALEGTGLEPALQAAEKSG